MKEFKKGDYVYYVNRDGDTYPTKIYKVGRSGRFAHSVLVDVPGWKGVDIKAVRYGYEYRRWVHRRHVRLQVQEE